MTLNVLIMAFRSTEVEEPDGGSSFLVCKYAEVNIFIITTQNVHKRCVYANYLILRCFINFVKTCVYIYNSFLVP